jgi:hypothetical protein
VGDAAAVSVGAARLGGEFRNWRLRCWRGQRKGKSYD